jgi:hypothetical protein
VVVSACLVIHLLVIAPYQIYKRIAPENERLKTKIEDRGPKLDGFIDRIMSTDESGTSNSLIFLDVSIFNSGGAPSYADEYTVGVICGTNRFAKAEEISFLDEYKLPFIHKKKPWLVDLKRRQLISEKTIKSIPVGESVRGWLAFRLTGIKWNEYEQTNVVFSFLDINWKRTFSTNGFWHGKSTTLTNLDDLAMVIPGAENIFYPVPPEIRTNWLPPELPPGCSNVIVYFGSQQFSYSRQLAEISDSSNGTQFAISELPDDFLKDLDAMPNYNRRVNKIWLSQPQTTTSIGGRIFPFPIQPVVVSNRLYVEVEVPFSNEKRKLVMSDTFDSDLTPIPRFWDRNYSTNYDEYGNGNYCYEVVNELTNPVLQVVYAAPNVVLVNGIFKIDSDSIYAAFGQPPSLLTFSNYDRYDLQTTQRITTISLKSDTFSEILAFRTNDTLTDIGVAWTNEFYRPIFKYQRPIFKYPSNRNPGAFADWTEKTNNKTNHAP